MSQSQLQLYTTLLIKAEAARAVGDLEDYFALQARADEMAGV